MRYSAIGQYSPLSGVIAVVLLVVATALVGLIGYLPRAEDVLGSLAADRSSASIGTYLGALSMFFTIWFAGSLRSSIRAFEDHGGRASAIAFGGGIVAAIAIGLSFVAASAMFDRAGTSAGIDAAGALALYDLRSALLGEALPIGFGIMAGATAVAAVTTPMLPAWFGWLSVGVALVCLSPIGFLGLIAGVAWIVIVGIWLSIRAAADTDTVARVAAAGAGRQPPASSL
jgi:membrane-associated protease RseP (regulator of RpoE activity)